MKLKLIIVMLAIFGTIQLIEARANTGANGQWFATNTSCKVSNKPGFNGVAENLISSTEDVKQFAYDAIVKAGLVTKEPFANFKCSDGTFWVQALFKRF